MLCDIIHRCPAPCAKRRRHDEQLSSSGQTRKMGQFDERMKAGEGGGEKRTGNKFAVDLIRFSRLPVIVTR
jgi:hypothetical protein